MNLLMTLLVLVCVAFGSFESGVEALQRTVAQTEAVVERLNVEQIGQLVSMHNIEQGRKLTNEELASFLRKSVGAGGRDAASDMWGTPYYLETQRWFGVMLSERGPDFAVCSAGPDRKWLTADDVRWTNFAAGRS